MQVGRESFAIPLSTVKETVLLEEPMLHVINNHKAVMFREEIIPLIHSGQLQADREIEQVLQYLAVGLAAEQGGLQAAGHPTTSRVVDLRMPASPHDASTLKVAGEDDKRGCS